MPNYSVMMMIQLCFPGFLFDMSGSYVLPYIVAGTLGVLSAVTFRISMLPSLCGRKSSLHEVDVEV